MDKIHGYRAEGFFVAAVALDASSAFDTLSHDVILNSLWICGSGPNFINWSRSFLSNCTNIVQIEDASSSPWVTKIGSAQGRRLSGDYYNVGTMSQAVLSKASDFAGYVDDGMDVVHGRTIEECNRKISSLIDERILWYNQIGISLNIAKTELIGFGFVPDPISIGNTTISPSSEITFLGVKIQSDLRWKNHVTTICNRIRSAAGRIRVDGRNFDITDKRKLFSGWILGLINSNGLVYLPSATKSELLDLQTAMNAGIRAVMGIPRYGLSNITAIRKKLNLPSVEDLKNRIVSVEAWKRLASYNEAHECTGPTTRARSNLKIPLPDLRGHRGKMTNAFLTPAWNNLPLPIKKMQSFTNVKFHIKKLFM